MILYFLYIIIFYFHFFIFCVLIKFFISCRVRVYGPGIEPSGVVIGAPTNFTIETLSAGKGDVEVIVEDFQGVILPVRTIFRNINIFRSLKHLYLWLWLD